MTDPSIPEGMPLVMAVSAPLKLVAKDGRDRWKPTLEDINRSTYDYLKLNRASGFIDGNVAPYMMLVGFDGSLAMPALPEFSQSDVALKIFNRVFLEMLLGGVYTEGAAPSDICSGCPSHLPDAPRVEVSQLLMIDAGDVGAVKEGDVVLGQRPFVILHGARAFGVCWPLLHPLNGQPRDVPKCPSLDRDAVVMLDLALSLDLDGGCHRLLSITLLGRPRDPLPGDLETRYPNLAVCLKIDMEAIVNVMPLDQVVHRTPAT